jgi:hypothetical protein
MDFEPYTPEGSFPIEFEPHSPDEPPSIPEEKKIDFGSPELNTFFESLPAKSKASILSLPERDQRVILRMTKEKKEQKKMELIKEVAPTSSKILQVEEEKVSDETESKDSESKSSEVKSVSFSEPANGDLKKINL